MQNGIPWWYFQRQRRPARGAHGRLRRSLRGASPPPSPKRLIGCVVCPAAEIAEPARDSPHRRAGVSGRRTGCVHGRVESERVKRVSEALVGYRFPRRRSLPSIRSEIWLKLWGNLTFNPISPSPHSTLVDICQYPAHPQLARKMMRRPGRSRRAGHRLPVDIDRRIAGAERSASTRPRCCRTSGPGAIRDRRAGRHRYRTRQRRQRLGGAHEAVYAMVKLLGRTMKGRKVYVRAHRSFEHREKNTYFSRTEWHEIAGRAGRFHDERRRKPWFGIRRILAGMKVDIAIVRPGSPGCRWPWARAGGGGGSRGRYARAAAAAPAMALFDAHLRHQPGSQRAGSPNCAPGRRWTPRADAGS